MILVVAVIAGILVWQKKWGKSQIDIVVNKDEYATKSPPENPIIRQDESVSLVISKSTTENEFFYPADEIENMMKSLYEEAGAHINEDVDAYIDLAVFEADLHASLANGWTPPWQNLAPKLTREECVKMPTLELSEACFSSSVFARELLLFDKPILSFSRLKILYPCYAELFERDDLWEGVLSAYSLYASHLGPESEPNETINSLMGLDNLPRIFQLPNMRKQLEGKELLFVHAQLESIKKIRSYIEGDTDDFLVSSTPFFSVTTPVSLVNLTLVFMQKVSVSQSASAIDTISELQLPKSPKMGQIKNYMDISITEIEQFLNSYQE
jgi:hypothetical protein